MLLNSIILSLEGYVNASDSIRNKFNLSFTIIFTVEMVLKLYGLGLSNYFREKMNIFDFLIVILSLVEIIVFGQNTNSGFSAFRTVRLFRILRVLRVTRLIRSLQYMRFIIKVIGNSIDDFVYIALLLLLFLYIYTLLGMQIFGGQFKFERKNEIFENSHDNTRQNFDNFFNSFKSVFQIMTIENWQEIMFLCFRSRAPKAFTILFLITWIILGNYVLLNLFFAILLNGFSLKEAEKEIIFDDVDEKEEINKLKENEEKSSPMKKSFYSKKSIVNNEEGNLKQKQDEQEEEDEEDNYLKKQKTRVFFEYFKDIECERTFFLLDKNNSIRKFCYKMIENKRFDQIITILIFLSSSLMVFESYEDEFDDKTKKKLNVGFHYSHYFFTICFTSEAIIKIISFGFFYDKNSYLRESWSILDFIIVVTSLVDILIEGVNLEIFRIFRLLRTLRPLRFISHNKNMKIVVNSLLTSVGAILNVLIVMLLIW